MAFKGINMTPIGGNSRSGENLDNNAPMGWAYQSSTDNLAVAMATGYFDTFNKYLVAGQFIYTSLSDGKFFVTVASVDRVLSQVVIDDAAFEPGGGSSGIITGSVTPIGNVTEAPGTLYKQVDILGNSSLWIQIGLTTNNTDWVSMRENTVLAWNAISISPSSTTNYLLPGNQKGLATGNENTVKFFAPRAGILKNFFVRQDTDEGPLEGLITYNVRINSINTVLSINLPSNVFGDGFEDIVNFVPVSAGQIITISVNKSGTITSPPDNIYATLGFL